MAVALLRRGRAEQGEAGHAQVKGVVGGQVEGL